MRKFFSARRQTVAFLSTVALTSTTLGLGLMQAPAAHADSWGCRGLIDNNFVKCLNSEKDYDQPITDPWTTNDPKLKYEDQGIAVARCLDSDNGKCKLDPSGGAYSHTMYWEIDTVSWINPHQTEYYDSSKISTSAASYSCDRAGGTRSISTTFTPGHGVEFESFGFLPDVGGDREFHPNHLSKAFTGAASLLGDLTFGAAVPDKWQLGETQTANVSGGHKAWIDMTPGFVKLTGHAILHMQYRWDNKGTWHHKDLRVPEATLVVPHTVHYNSGKIQSSIAAFKDALITRSEWNAHCKGQSPSPYHNLQIKVGSSTKGIEIVNHSTGYDHCFAMPTKKPTWFDAHASDSRTSVFQGENIEVRRYSSILCGYPHTNPTSTFKKAAPGINGMTNWWIS